MQDENGTLKYEQKDYHHGMYTTTTASSASIQMKSTKLKHNFRLHDSNPSALKSKLLIGESKKRSDMQTHYEKASINQHFIRGIYKKQQNGRQTENIDKIADSHKNHHKIPATNNDKSYPDDTFFTKENVVEGKSKNVVPAKSFKGYEVRNNGTSFTPTLNNMYTTTLENTGNKTYTMEEDKHQKAHLSSDLFSHPKKFDLLKNELEISDVVRNGEKWWNTKVGSERLREAKQQNINSLGGPEQTKIYNMAKNKSDENILSVDDELLPVSSSKLHMVRVLPPQDFIDKLKDKERENTALSSINGLADEKMDKKALDLMKLFMDHTDDFELDEEEITDLKERAKDIEGQMYKRTLKESGNQLEKRKPRLSRIILNKIKEAEEISKLKTENKHAGLQKYLINSIIKDGNEGIQTETSEYNQIEERRGSFQIMNSSEQTLQPRFSSLMFGLDKERSFPRKKSSNFNENSFSPSARTVDDGFASIFSRPPHQSKHFSKFRKPHHAGPPILTSIPPTSFTCTDGANSEVKRTAGYYADPETNCQVC